jgi:hypothetical protein
LADQVRYPNQPIEVGLEEKFEETNSKSLTNFYYPPSPLSLSSESSGVFMPMSDV